MAIEYFLRGDFDVDSTLRERLLGALGDDVRALEPVGPRQVFVLASPLLWIAGSEAGGGRDSTLHLRVIDKERVMEATEQMVACVAAVLEDLGGDEAELWLDEHVILRRKGDSVRLKDPGEWLFWNAERRRILGMPRR
ncbi:hypothetical protein [Sandaracinus amylolyticus]|uniref:hypothetical protein n=1 Tax=Sandaracinus amylolyticus TaxID=927083 RepID=UPI001F3BB021|nr:hypothetical protein [Sandaracinus amylolyticus]UJR86130.1 Hypothetical protein I5071_82110 [Sandaracinus amylolyticus]